MEAERAHLSALEIATAFSQERIRALLLVWLWHLAQHPAAVDGGRSDYCSRFHRSASDVGPALQAASMDSHGAPHVLCWLVAHANAEAGLLAEAAGLDLEATGALFEV